MGAVHPGCIWRLSQNRREMVQEVTPKIPFAYALVRLLEVADEKGDALA